MSERRLMQAVGAALIGLVALQLGVILYASLFRLRGLKQQRDMSLKVLQEQIEAANALRVQREQSHLCWNGYRKFVVERKVTEADQICSLYLVPHDRKPLPLYQPGQFLTFRFDLPEHEKPVIRCYSLSDSPSRDYYRVTVKRVPPPRDQPDAPPGLISNFVHDAVEAGDILDVQAPRGPFTLDPLERKPAVLIGGGVGITPLLCMVNTVVRTGSEREIWLFYGVRHGREHAMKRHFESLDRDVENFHYYAFYSSPGSSDVQGRDYHYGERISVDRLKEVLGTSNYEFYICGPPPMMSGLIADLQEWGVPDEHIMREAFGASTVKTTSKARSKEKEPAQEAKEAGPAIKVTFSKSEKSLEWDGACANLLDFALENGISIDSGCRAGNCGTCLVALKSGRVNYLSDLGAEPEDGSCLTCVSVPEEDVVLDA